jgi:hypothetical protein
MSPGGSGDFYLCRSVLLTTTVHIASGGVIVSWLDPRGVMFDLTSVITSGNKILDKNTNLFESTTKHMREIPHDFLNLGSGVRFSSK